ncbi:PA3715 family protein [Maribacter flavus]|uniref:Uncharacterized protein n=1 Tax=Maribacter flavus TaxID=1658664 RepID=A0A5B2TYW7_9FLAO|nr:hypothetical protein [Maribacter flavus]KAA2218820.1 hypothetical protein F0361_04120 [Maribacter flavus]
MFYKIKRKKFYVAIGFLIISCGQGPKKEKAPEIETQGAVEMIEAVVDSIPDDEGFDFLKTISNTKTLKLPHIENTNFDSFIDEDDYEVIDFKAFNLNQIYPDYNAEGRNYRAIAKYTVPIRDNFHSVVVTILKSENEMESVLINYDPEGTIIAHELVSYDEIAEGMSRTVSRISENRLTVDRIFWGNIREVEQIEYEITWDGTIEKVDTKKLNDSFKNYTLINSVLMDLKLDWIQIKTDLIATKVYPENPEETIVVIPEIVDEGEHYFALNSHILIADNRSGKVTHKYFESKKTNEWVSDAIELNGIQIDSTSYQISEDKMAFGVTVSRFGSSRVNPYSNKALSLFVKSGDSLVKVLSNYTVENYGGEWDGDCDGEFNETKKSLRMGQEKNNGYFDIWVDAENSYTHSFKDKNGDCLSEMKLNPKTTILKFNGWRYSEYDTETIAYAEYAPEKKVNVRLENVHVGHAFQMEPFILLSGLYMPKNGKIVFPDTETDNGYRVFLVNEDNEIHYKSKGFGDLYHFEPHFYKSEASDKTIIICQLGFEYPFGGEVFIYQNEKMEHIGTLDIEGYDPEQNGTNYLTEIIEIKEGKTGIEFSFKTDRLILNPGGEHEEVITNNNVFYVYKNNELSLLWNN